MEAAGPGVLKVEATGDAVDVHNFSREVEAVHKLALHRLEVDLVQRNAAARDELIFVRTLATDRECRGCQLAEKSGRLFLAELRPRRGVGDFSGCE